MRKQLDMRKRNITPRNKRKDNENPVWVPGRLTRNIKTEDQEDDNSGDPHADPGSANKSAERTTVGNNVNLPPPDAGDV